MRLTSRPYQNDVREQIRKEISLGNNRVLLVMPTGAGKTFTFCDIAERASSKGNSITILVHRAELLSQTSLHLEKLGLRHGLIAPNHTQTIDPIQVASVQTLIRRLDRVKKPSLLIIDEAHHSNAGSWKKILDAWHDIPVIGVTATPIRLDGKSLGDIYQKMVLGPSIRWLIDNGFLCQPKVYGPTNVDLSGVCTVMGDFDKKEVSKRVDKPQITGDVVKHYLRYCPNTPAIAFCASIKHAEHVAEEFNKNGIPAGCIDGTQSNAQRQFAISQLQPNRAFVLCSCDIVSEGTDIPVVGAALLLRPTQSKGLYMQQVGRSLRLFEGKTHAIILDHVGNWERHGLPDDDQNWTLEKGSKFNKKKSNNIKPVRRCEKCYAIFSASKSECPQCGAGVVISERELKTADGELNEITPAMRQAARIQQGQARGLTDLLNVARTRGYNPAWAYNVHNAREAKKLMKGQGMRV